MHRLVRALLLAGVLVAALDVAGASAHAADAPPAPVPVPAPLPAPLPAPVPAMGDVPAAPAAPAAPAGDATPAARARAVRAALPAPSAALAFVFDADLWVGKARSGSASYEVRPSGTPARPTWTAHEESRPQGGARPRVFDTTAVLDATLRMLSYDRSIRVEGGAAATTKASWTEVGELRVEKTDEQGETTVTTSEAVIDTTATVAGLLLFLRACPAEPAPYELPVFVHDTGQVDTGHVEVRGPGELAFASVHADAFVATFRVGTFTFELYLDRKDRAPLAIHQPQSGVWFVAKHLHAVEDVEPVPTDGPAPSALACGMRFALGLLVGDLALVEAAIDWPALHAAANARAGAEDDLDTFKQVLLASFERQKGQSTRPQADGIVRAAAEAGTETPDGDGILVTFGGMFRGLVYRAKAFDGAWRIVDLPGGK